MRAELLLAMRSLVLTLLVYASACSGGSSGQGAKTVVEPPASGTTSTPVADPKAIADLDLGERRIEVAGSDCAAACNGLTTMTRARIKLCSPRTSTCDDAEKREGDARKKVAAFCEACP
jgi:hypothetical protein